jgi:dCMP deaminase
MKPSWDEFFLNLCETIKIRSPDPKTKVGSVLVSEDHRVIANGYNGLPSGCDENIDWTDRILVRKMIIHSEVNTILYAQSRYKNATLYTSLSPCCECIKVIAAAGIKRVIYSNEYKDILEVKKLCNVFSIEITKITKKMK